METPLQTLRREAVIVLGVWPGKPAHREQWATHFAREAGSFGFNQLARAAAACTQPGDDAPERWERFRVELAEFARPALEHLNRRLAEMNQELSAFQSRGT